MRYNQNHKERGTHYVTKLHTNPCISDFQFYNFPSHIGFSLMGKISDQHFFHGNTSIFYFLTCLKFLIRRLRQFFL